VTGWYDDWGSKLSSIDGDLTGEVEITFDDYVIRHTSLDLTTNNITSTDFSIEGTSRVYLDDDFDRATANLTTRSTVHWTLGHSHPHQGQIRIKDGSDWVNLTFETSGLWREDSNGGEHFWSWSELGFE